MDIFGDVLAVVDACVEPGEGGLGCFAGLGVGDSGVQVEFECVWFCDDFSGDLCECEPSDGGCGFGQPVVDSCGDSPWVDFDLENGQIGVSDFCDAVDCAFEPHGCEQCVGVGGVGFGVARDCVDEQWCDWDIGCFDGDCREGLVIGEEGIGFDGCGSACDGVE